MKILPVEAELFRADGQTELTKLILPFQNFVNATKNTEWSYKKNRWRSTSTNVSDRARWVIVVVLRLQVKLERTDGQKKKTKRPKNKRYQLVNKKKIQSIYREQITHLQSSNQTDMELRNRTVVLRQQVQNIHHAENPIQNSQSHNKCIPVCNKSYAPHRLKHPLRQRRHPWKNQ